MTHTRKKADGINGTESTKDLILLEQKEPKSPQPQRVEGPQSVGKDEVGGSNPPSSSKNPRKLQFSGIFCCKKLFCGVAQKFRPTPRPTSAQVPDHSLHPGGQSSLLSLCLCFQTRPAALGSRLAKRPPDGKICLPARFFAAFYSPIRPVPGCYP